MGFISNAWDWVQEQTVVGDAMDWANEQTVLGDVNDWIGDQTGWDFLTISSAGLLSGDMFSFDLPDLPNLKSATYSSNSPSNTINESVYVARAYGYCNLAGNIVRVSPESDEKLMMVVAHCQGPTFNSTKERASKTFKKNR